LEQRAQRPADAARVAAREVHAGDGLVHLAHPTLVAGHHRRGPLLGAAVARREPTPWQRQLDGPRRPRQRPRLRAVAVAVPVGVPLVRRGAERRAQLLLDGLLDRPADGLVDQFAERDLITSYETQVPGTFLHGRIPPVRPGVVPGVLNTRENAPSSISTRMGTRPLPTPKITPANGR